MTKEKEKTFEEKLKELETIVSELESGNIDLDSSIEKYTNAMKLVKECDDSYWKRYFRKFWSWIKYLKYKWGV